jgi:hypothetical protein
MIDVYIVLAVSGFIGGWLAVVVVYWIGKAIVG